MDQRRSVGVATRIELEWVDPYSGPSTHANIFALKTWVVKYAIAFLENDLEAQTTMKFYLNLVQIWLEVSSEPYGMTLRPRRETKY